MDKREKVIKGIRCCVRKYVADCANCSYNDMDTNCDIEMMKDALELLKAQEPVEPKKVNRYIDVDDEGHPYNPETYDCGSCGMELPQVANYCPNCGRPVKWDG